MKAVFSTVLLLGLGQLIGLSQTAGLWQTGAPVDLTPVHPSDFRFLRPVTVSMGQPQTACAVLDSSVFAHADTTLNDLRVFTRQPTPIEVPFVLTTSRTEPVGDSAQVINLGMTGDRISFDLQMPPRPYTDVELALKGQDFIATAKVSGLTQAQAAPVTLGTFTLFDLNSQHLGRSTRLPLQEETFPLLHVELTVSGVSGHGFAATPAMVEGAQIPPSREAQTLYTTVAETTDLRQVGSRTLASFQLPARIPVERVEFALAPGDHRNFSRNAIVNVQLRPEPVKAGEVAAPPMPFMVSGTISRVHTVEGGREIRYEDLNVPAEIGTPERGSHTVDIAIENGDDRPLAIRSVRLAMRERKLCFDAPAEPVALYYGADQMRAGVYDYSRFFQPTAPARVAKLGPEQANGAYHPLPPPAKTFVQRHPQLIWLALVAAIGILSAVAFRSAKRS